MTRYSHIDCLRGLAALSVVYFHTAEFALKHGIVHLAIEQNIFLFFTQWADLGKIAVAVFFAISGFVIPFSLLKPQPRPLLAFAISRLLRLYPAYWVSIPFGIVFFYILLHRNFSADLVLSNMTMLQQFAGMENIIGVYWTLQIEIIFYVISALLFFFGFLSQPKSIFLTSLFFLACATGLGALRFALDIKFPVALPLALSIMFWGLSWRLHLSTPEEDRETGRFWPLTAVMVVGVLIVSVLAYSRDMGFGETWYRYTITYYCSFAIFLLFTSKIILKNRVLTYLGAVSYSVYLFGPIGQELAIYVFHDTLSFIPIHLLVAVAMLITIAIAAVVYRYVEAPSIKLGKHLVEMLNQQYLRA